MRARVREPNTCTPLLSRAMRFQLFKLFCFCFLLFLFLFLFRFYFTTVNIEENDSIPSNKMNEKWEHLKRFAQFDIFVFLLHAHKAAWTQIVYILLIGRWSAIVWNVFLILSKHGFYCTRINLSSNFTCHALDMLKTAIIGFFTTFFSCQVQLLHFTVLFLLHCNQAYTVLCRVATSLTPAISVFLKRVLRKQKEPITFNKENFEQKSWEEVCICWR